MSNFVVSKEEVANFCKNVEVSNMEGISFCFQTTPEVLAKLLPPGFEPVSPHIGGYICQIADFTCGEPYMEFMIMCPCKFGDTYGAYPFGLMISGPAPTEAFLHGRETCGFPKKMADYMEVHRVGNTCTGKIIRKGVTLFQIKVNLAEDPEPEAMMAMPDRPVGEVRPGLVFLHKYDLRMTPDGACKFSNCEVNGSLVDSTTVSFEKGSAEIKFNSSIDDPYGEFEVVKVVGGAWYRDGYCPMKGLIPLGPVDTEETMPYLLTSRYDRGCFEYVSRHDNR